MYSQCHTVYNQVISLFRRIFKRVKSLNERPRTVFDSHRIIGSFIEHEYSPNGEYCAFTVSAENLNTHKIIVVNVRTGQTLGNLLQIFNCKKIAWSEDSEGFFIYVNIDAIALNIFSLKKMFFQYDPEGKRARHLYYHFVNEHRPDKLIAKIRKTEAHAVSFKVSNDYKYLILRDSRRLQIANIKSLEREIKFELIFKLSSELSYVSNQNRKKTSVY